MFAVRTGQSYTYEYEYNVRVHTSTQTLSSNQSHQDDHRLSALALKRFQKNRKTNLKLALTREVNGNYLYEYVEL